MSKRILIVRTSSLGDLVHMLPAISDIALHVPGACIDWIVEESFAEIPTWHPAVNEVIPVAHRRWRKHWWSAETRAERRSEEHTSELQSLMRISYAVFCLTKNTQT